MTGNFENEFADESNSGDAELAPLSEEPLAPGEGAGAYRPLKFSAWGAAHREVKPSVWSRIGKLFKRDKTAESEAAEVTEVFEAAVEADADVASIDAPPPDPLVTDLSFAEERPTEVEAIPVEEFSAPQATADADVVEEIMPGTEDVAPAQEKRPSFLKRLFGRKSKPVAAGEEIGDLEPVGDFQTELEPSAGEAAQDPAFFYPDSEPGPESAPEPVGAAEPEPVAELVSEPSVFEQESSIGADIESALPMDEPPVSAASADTDVEVEPLVVEKKPGLFSRLFGRRKSAAAREVEAIFDAAPVDVSGAADVEAAHEVFAAASDPFAGPIGEESPEKPAFLSLDEALPGDDPLVAEPVAEMPSDARATLEVAADSRSTMEVEGVPAIEVESSSNMQVDNAPTAEVDSRPTMEVESRPTMEVEVPSRATLEVTPASVSDSADLFGDTIDPAELTPAVAESREPSADGAIADPHALGMTPEIDLDRKTDEFEVFTMQEPAIPAPDEDEDTEEVPKPTLLGRFLGRSGVTKTIVEPAAPPASAHPDFLVTEFRTFYNEVVVYKNQKAEFTGGFATAIVTDYTADLSPDQAAQTLSARLQQMLETQLAKASWMGGEARERYPDAQYAMAALADEMLEHMDWPGQGAWSQHSLEQKLYKTRGAGVEFFKRVDKLLKEAPDTPGARDLARVYLLVVASGFQGKYRPFKLQRPLAEYRRRLYEFVYKGDALMLYADDRRIFPEVDSRTVVGKAVSRFSMAQQWAAILIFLLVGYTVISHMAWNRVSADLRDVTARVEAAKAAAPVVNSAGGVQ